MLGLLLVAVCALPSPATEKAGVTVTEARQQLHAPRDRLATLHAGSTRSNAQGLTDARAALTAWEATWITVEQAIPASDRDSCIAIDRAALIAFLEPL